ncbi:MAG TPA: DegT/DnrJ/EryC1/StrS family aminotransferase [Verrucomicrobiota bacterium]|jgi:perosamine synthetase|nr:DegT/DnrJ/EryC1/StrS family aminotransferase [Verrucomicrobiota bacterium]
MKQNFIPVNEPLLDGNEKKYLTECIETGWISSEGPFVRRLEEGMAQRVGRAHGIAVCNGSAALDVTVAALRLGPGDEVILPSFTIISCAQAIVRAGATPVVVDSDPRTWNMNPDQVAEKITPRTRAIMVVHIYGLPVDMDPILALARKHGLKIIEDAAEAIGQTYGRQREEVGDQRSEVGGPWSVVNGQSSVVSGQWSEKACGSFGDISALSFYPNKHVTTGEGGMVLTDDPALAERCRSLRNLCFQKKRFVHDELGWNFRMSNLQAALGVAQLERLDEFIGRKRRMGALYHEALRAIPWLELPLPRTDYAENIYWVYGLVLKDEVPFDAEEAMRRLGAAGVGTRPFFWPMHEQPVFRKQGLFANESCPVAERLARRGFYIPGGLALTDDQLESVVSIVRRLA